MNKWLLIAGGAALTYYLLNKGKQEEAAPVGVPGSLIAPGDARPTESQVRTYLGDWLSKSSDPLVARVSRDMFTSWPADDLPVLYEFVTREKGGLEIPQDLHDGFTQTMNRFYNAITANYS